MYRIIGADGQQYGPVSAEQLRQWMVAGRVNEQTRIQAEGSPDWKPLAAFPEFAPTVAPPPVAAPPAASTKTSGWAISSLVLGVLGFTTCGLTALPGLILGIVGLNKIKRSGGQLGGQGLAIGGICVSGASLLMVPILVAGMLLPALSSAREKARQVQCMSNLKQLSLAIAIYADQNMEQVPAAANWCDALKTTVATEKVFQCPSGTGERCSYALNANMSGGEWQGDPDVVLLIDAPLGWNGTVSGPESVPESPHRRYYNVSFNDGHVESVTAERVKTLKWKPEKKSL